MSNDFTIERYREVLLAAKQKYRIEKILDFSDEGNVALWRHDIDFSPHRALALAQMEANVGVLATYFVQISSRFYNIFEPEIAEIIRKIGELGHDIGLHFSAESFNCVQGAEYEQRMAFETGALEHIAQKDVLVFSIHNPSTMVGVSFDELRHCGLFNASHSSLREDFSYCSDSNGIWRFRSLDAMVADPQITRLYALTHPEWWQETVILPRQRIQRCIDGRAAYGAQYYDSLLADNGRPNVGAEKLNHRDTVRRFTAE